MAPVSRHKPQRATLARHVAVLKDEPQQGKIDHRHGKFGTTTAACSSPHHALRHLNQPSALYIVPFPIPFIALNNHAQQYLNLSLIFCTSAPMSQQFNCFDITRNGGNSTKPPPSTQWYLTKQVCKCFLPNNLMTDSWDKRNDSTQVPALAASRAQILPIATSNSSLAANVNAIMTGNANGNGSLSPRSSVSSYASMASSRTTSSYSSALSSPSSLVSRSSVYSGHMKARSRAPPRPIFQKLPPEIYDCILRQLRVYHEDERSQSCQTCYQRDLCSLSATSRAWDKVVVKRL